MVVCTYLSYQEVALFADCQLSVMMMMMMDAMSLLKTQNTVLLTAITTGTDKKSKHDMTNYKNHPIHTNSKSDILTSDKNWTK